MTATLKALPARRASIFALVAVAVLSCAFFLHTAVAHAATFDPALVISNDSFRAYDSMSAADIQAFLETRPGVLRSLVTTDYAGQKKRASQIIWEACQHAHVSPMVMLTMLQKEQSLLTRTTLVTGYKSTLDWAIGMGCPDTGGRYEKYRGFGKQLWYGSWVLDTYGEKGRTRPSGYVEPGWVPDSGMTVGSPGGNTNLVVKNLATFKLYTYNPSIGATYPYGDLSKQADTSGNASFWKIYYKNFGDPTGDPKVAPVFRFVNRATSKYFYTASYAERYATQAHSSKTWSYQGVAFTYRTTMTTATVPVRVNEIPVYRVQNLQTGGWTYTAAMSRVRRLTAGSWRYRGIAWWQTADPTGATALYSFLYKPSGSVFYTSVRRDRVRVQADSHYRLTGYSLVKQ